MYVLLAPAIQEKSIGMGVNLIRRRLAIALEVWLQSADRAQTTDALGGALMKLVASGGKT
jgi:hypothetical protein